MSQKATKLKKNSEFHQPYNADWEKLPIFQGWLSSVPENKYRAICKFCKKEFRAHRTDLRTHAQSRKHKQNADNHYFNVIESEKKITASVDQSKESAELCEEAAFAKPCLVREDKSAESQDRPASFKPGPQDHLDTADDNSRTSSSSPLQDAVSTSQPIPSTLPAPLRESQKAIDITAARERLMFREEHQSYIISTQVQDMVKGLPVDRLVIHLFAFRNNLWRKFGKGVTEKNGRCTKFIKLNPNEDRIVPGLYKLRYETKMHFTLNLDESIFPFIEVSFEVVDLSEQYEVNLLLSPYSYMIFRKS